MITCSSLLALVVTGFELRSSYNQGVADIEEMHEELILVHGDVLIQQVWSLDEYAAQVSIEGLVRLNAIDRVELSWDGYGNWEVGEPLLKADIETVLPLNQLRDNEYFILGELRLVSNLDRLRLEIISLLGVKLFFNFLKTLVVSFVVLYFFHHIASVHIHSISLHADSLALGASYKPLVLDQGTKKPVGELQVLIDAINRMGSRLQQDFVRRENAQSELERLVGERTQHLEDANRRLIEKSRLATIGSLVAMVAHELRNPLGSIKASVSLLSARCSEGDDTYVIQRIERNIDRCDETVEQLRRMGNKSVQHWAVVDLSAWMLDYVENKLQINDGIELRCDFPPDLTVFVDQFQLDMVVRNLMENAEHAMNDLPDDSERSITLSTCLDGEYALLRVSDSGRGLERATLNRAFDPLFSTKQYGFGMGLTLSKNLVEFLGGELQLSSQGEMQGAVALLRLPLARSTDGQIKAQIGS